MIMRFVFVAALLAQLSLAAAETGLPVGEPAPPTISPDYSGVALPLNIAPPNFTIKNPGKSFVVSIRAAKGAPFEINSSTPAITIPFAKWKSLLAGNPGKPLYFEISAQSTNGEWTFFDRITNSISTEPIDSHLVYRLMKPIYNFYKNIGIYQRNLETFEQREVLANEHTANGCLNCHTFLNNSPDNMAFHTRGKSGKPMILVRTNEAVQVGRTAGYLAWHPSGRMISFSVNKVTQFFHSAGSEPREVFDSVSDVGALHLDTLIDETPHQLSNTNLMETWPAWSPDGKYLYFCRGPRLPEDKYETIQYDLMRVSYDIDKNVWGEPETIIAARDIGASCAQPKVSPDGKWLVLCVFNHGHFPAFQRGSDLYLLNLSTRKLRRIDEINSDQSESWHCWSHDSRWLVFASRRRDGLLALPYFARIDENGRFSKPFLLPQEDPEFYDKGIHNYNLPELITKPVSISAKQLSRAVLNPSSVMTFHTLTNKVEAQPKDGAIDSTSYQDDR